jgi:TonB family protein
VRATAPPPSPFDDAPVSFYISGLRFGVAQVATVRLCVTADGQVTHATLLESSGDDRFDQLALIWARRVRMRKDSDAGHPFPGDAPGELCGPVRVELRLSPKHGLSGPSEAVG